MPELPVVTIIVISYNTRAMTLECLRSVVAQTKTPYELIVLDNASTDGSAEAIADEFSDLHLIAEDQNHGFAKANNMIAEIARGEYLLLLNPDTVVLNGAVDKLVEFAMQRPQARIWGGRTLFADGSLNPKNSWRRMSLWSISCRATGLDNRFPQSSVFNSEGYGEWQRQSEREVDIVTGCLFLIERDFWHRLGGFDLRYIMYGEEADLCLRARSFGARPRITPDAEIVHYAGASESLRARKLIMLLQAKISLVNRHFAPGQRSLGVRILRAWPLSRFAVSVIAHRLNGNKAAIETYECWREVWARRSEWRNGYPASDHSG